MPRISNWRIRIDWQRVKQVIKARDGIAVEVTKNTAEVNKGAASPAASTEFGGNLYSGEVVNKPVEPVTTPVQRRDLKKKPQSGFVQNVKTRS